MSSHLQYLPNRKSIDTHQLPDWFKGAKLGIFIHWGLYSVPAFAPTEFGDIHEIISKHGFKFHFAHNPYAEWYQNSLRINAEPYRSYHLNNFGKDFKYEDFAEIFNESIKKWDPNSWADLFKEIGARYVVLTTKHHDGFLLWNSSVKNPNIENYHASRNIVKELSEAVKSRGMKMGLYYSGALDWSFQPDPIRDVTTQLANGPVSEEYAKYVDNHYFELIDNFNPDILWNDIAYPPKGDLYGVISYFLNKNPEGTFNDRWARIPPIARILQRTFIIKALINYFVKMAIKKQGLVNFSPKVLHEYFTPEYAPNTALTLDKWESCRGIGRSFGFNKMEKEEHYLSNKELIHGFIDIVSKNGNLLLNIGPMADGTIPKIQVDRLKALGNWLRINEEGIFQSEPWFELKKREIYEENITAKYGTQTFPVRFTKKNRDLYVFLLGTPDSANSGRIRINHFPFISEISNVAVLRAVLLKEDQELEVHKDGTALVYNLTPDIDFLREDIAIGIKMEDFFLKNW